jgi:hypothetical protein
MSRAPALKPEHAAALRALRQAHPFVGMPQLARLLAAEVGLTRPPSRSALHRFMQAHGVARLEVGANHGCAGNLCPQVLNQRTVVQLARRALVIASSMPRAAFLRDRPQVEFVSHVADVFTSLVWVTASDGHVPGVDKIARTWRDWITSEVPAAHWSKA